MSDGQPVCAHMGGGSSRVEDATDLFLRDRDVPCPRCGYNLRSTQSARCCPECGCELVLVLDNRAARERLALWVSTAWCATVGAAGVAPEALAWYFNHWRPPRPWSAEDALALALLGAMLVYGMTGLIALVRTRRRPMPSSGRWLRAGWMLWAGLALGLAYYAVRAGLAITRVW
jgi:hypothetical protein